MLKFSRKVDYGLIALRHIAGQPDAAVSSAREIAEAYRLSYELLSKILQTLKRQKVIDSVQGVAGGYRLARDLAGITLFDFVEMLEGPIGIVDCTRSDPGETCSLVADCNILLPMRKLNLRLMGVLRETSLQELFSESGPLPAVVQHGDQAKPAEPAAIES